MPSEQGERMSKSNARSLSSWPVTYRWIAAGTIAVYSAIGCEKIRAEQLPAPAAPRGAATVTALPARRFEIAAGPIRDAISAFGQITGLKVTLGTEGLGQIATPGVSGILTPEQALDSLLRDTGVRWKLISPRTVLLELNAVSTSVDVTSTPAELSPSLVRYTEPLRDTPQTVEVVSQKTIAEQNATTLRDTLRNVAGISLAAGEGGAQGDNLTIRGFTARNDLYLDGMRDFGSYYRDPFDLEEVDVVQGPSSATFGRGSTGGVVNQATKVPSALRFFSGSFDAGTDLTRRGTADVNVPFQAFGHEAAFRLNLMGTEGDVAGRDIAKNRRYGLAPSLSLGMDTSTRWTFSYLRQGADDVPDYGIPWLFNQPAPVDRHNYYGFEDGNYLRTADNIGTVRVEHDFNSHITLRNQSRYARYLRDARITEAQIAGAVTASTPLDSVMVNRNEITVNSVEAFLANQSDAVMTFETGRVRHTATAGVELDREDSDPTRPKYTGVPTTSLMTPDPTQPFAGTAAISSLVRARSNSVGVYVMDTAKIGKRWELSGAARWDRFNTHYTQAVPPASAFNRVDEQPSFRGAIVFKPVEAGSIYVSAGTSFNPSAESLSLSASTANLPPEKNRTYEAGTKWDLPRTHMSLRAAFFRTDKLNAREPDPENSLLNVLAGQQRVNGIQIESSGHITSRWEALTSYAFLDAKLASSTYYPAAVGAPLANVPRHNFTFWHTYRLPWKTRIGAGGNFIGSRTASTTAPYDPVTGLVKQAPGYWVFNAMIERPLTEHITLHANVYNLADRIYYDQLHPAHVILGPARSALIGLAFKF
jgi:catecholate siderophore receptor